MSRFRILLLSLLGLALALLLVLTVSSPTVTADNRVNCHAASPIVIYCTDDGITILDITGQELLKVSAAELAAATVPAEGTVTELGSADNLVVYLLSNGQYLVAYFNAERGEWFMVYWEGCGEGVAGQGDIKVYAADLQTLISDADGCGADGGSSPVTAEECVSNWVCNSECSDSFERTTEECLAHPECRPACCYDTCVEVKACECDEICTEGQECLPDEGGCSCQLVEKPA